MKYLLVALLFIGILFTLPSFINSTHSKTSKIHFSKVEKTQPEELGKVNWQRDFDSSFAEAKQSGKPIFILFQEVPGCSTCRNYGNNVLSHPLIVEAIETLFVPVVVYNNKGGKDAEMLKYFGEPSWNNPVVRIVNDSKKDILPRLNGNYSAAGLVNYMLRGLDLYNQVAPNYLEILEDELSAKSHGLERATVSMYCFWTGEGKLGKVDGVVATKAGFMGGREVVQIDYNPQKISYEDLIATAKKEKVASHVYIENTDQKMIANKIVGTSAVQPADRFRLDREPKYYLSKTHYRYVPMTDLQATRANSLVGKGLSPDKLLSPQQVQLANQIQQNPNLKWKDAIEVDFLKAWAAIEAM